MRRTSGYSSNEQHAVVAVSYTVIIERDRETGWLIGEVLELPGCHTQAPDLSALEANMREAITAYLGSANDQEPASTFVGVIRTKVAA